ncbi:hypothetical protein HNR46_000907 [Haloferula luteola]|uniref:Uncharacterized protein n=1 Tax=Haloferula luteola TaxID=595692 RepID=A0A840VA69_9BACT|nr:hypothetical protein [Haloferula luteola]
MGQQHHCLKDLFFGARPYLGNLKIPSLALHQRQDARDRVT